MLSSKQECKHNRYSGRKRWYKNCFLNRKLPLDSTQTVMANRWDNTIQFRLITTIVGGLSALFQEREDVFVAGDLL